MNSHIGRCTLAIIAGLSCSTAMAGEPLGKCCFQNSQGQMQCANLTEVQCSTAGQPHLWEGGRSCGQDGIGCPSAACIDVQGSCLVTHNTPACNHPYCCTDVCNFMGHIGAFCCNVVWDSACVSFADTLCPIRPDNDECAPGQEFNQTGAITVPAPGSISINNRRATTTSSDPGFCCHGGVSSCAGGDNGGLPCTVDSECPAGTCPSPSPMAGALGYGSIWFKFVPPPGMTRAGIHTCNSNSPALDSVMQVFRVTNPSSPESACATLVPIGCNDDSTGCSSTGRNSRICLEGLIPGQTYYVAVAAKTPNQMGQYRVTITSSCTGGDFSCPEPVPAVSTWGMMVLTLIGLVVGSLVFKSPRPVAH